MSIKINLKDQQPDGAALPMAQPADVSGSYMPVMIMVSSGGVFSPLSVAIQKLWTGGDSISVAQFKSGGLTDYRVIQIFPVGVVGGYEVIAFAQDFNQNSETGNADSNYLPVTP